MPIKTVTNSHLRSRKSTEARKLIAATDVVIYVVKRNTALQYSQRGTGVTVGVGFDYMQSEMTRVHVMLTSASAVKCTVHTRRFEA